MNACGVHVCSWVQASATVPDARCNNRRCGRICFINVRMFMVNVDGWLEGRVLHVPQPLVLHS